MTAAYYELWDLDTGNCLGAYHEERDALAEVRAGVRLDGTALWQNVGLLLATDVPGDAKRIAAGADLIARAGMGEEPVGAGVTRTGTVGGGMIGSAARPAGMAIGAVVGGGGSKLEDVAADETGETDTMGGSTTGTISGMGEREVVTSDDRRDGSGRTGHT